MNTRRQILCSAAAVAAGATVTTLPALAADPPAPLKGRVKQSTGMALPNCSTCSQ